MLSATGSGNQRSRLCRCSSVEVDFCAEGLSVKCLVPTSPSLLRRPRLECLLSSRLINRSNILRKKCRRSSHSGHVGLPSAPLLMGSGFTSRSISSMESFAISPNLLPYLESFDVREVVAFVSTRSATSSSIMDAYKPLTLPSTLHSLRSPSPGSGANAITAACVLVE